MAQKRFYWLKLNENWFNEPKIRKLRKIAGGDTYTIIYLKMQLLSISNKGVIQFEKIENSFEEELALKLDEEIEDVQLTLSYLYSQGLIEKSNDDYLLPEACKNIGSESDSAERVRQFREREKEKMLQCNNDVTPYISISNNINNNISINKEEKEVIDYLNEKLGTNFKPIDCNIKFIRARLKDYTIEDLKAVIDKKYKEWIGTEMQQYLRPKTLFSQTNFENYFNSLEKRNSNKALNFESRTYNKEKLENLFDNLENIEV